MTWVHRSPNPVPRHECAPPVTEEPWFSPKPIGSHGDLWRCGCGILWIIRDAFNTNGPEWRRAGWWTCWRNRRAGRRPSSTVADLSLNAAFDVEAKR